MPVEERMRRPKKGAPPITGREAGEECDQRAVGPDGPGMGDLAAEHRELMAKHDDLGILGESGHQVDAEEPQDHGRAASSRATCEAKPFVFAPRNASEKPHEVR